jgi:hypothetical protein
VVYGFPRCPSWEQDLGENCEKLSHGLESAYPPVLDVEFWFCWIVAGPSAVAVANDAAYSRAVFEAEVKSIEYKWGRCDSTPGSGLQAHDDTIATVEVSEVLFGRADLGELRISFSGIPASAASAMPLGYKKGPDLCGWDIEVGSKRVFEVTRIREPDGSVNYFGGLSDCRRLEEVDGDWVIGGAPGGCKASIFPGGKATWKAWLAEVQAGQRCQDY